VGNDDGRRIISWVNFACVSRKQGAGWVVFECFTASCPDVGLARVPPKLYHDAATQTLALATTPHSQ
jgi:hypothetical protein